MTYDSTITFTLDTICPWTYLARARLSKALSQFRVKHPDSGVRFTLRYAPFQLNPEATKEGEDKYEWYKREKYDGSEERMAKYMLLMGSYGEAEGIEFRFGGTVANTLDAHRLIQWAQEEMGPEAADKVVGSLYSQYFEHEAHPAAATTLLKAATDAGIPEPKAKAFIEDERQGLQEVKMLIREQAANGVDAVPFVVVEGRKRDISLTGAKEVDQYVKALEQVMKESL